MKNHAEEVKQNAENRFYVNGYQKAIEWLACFMIPGEEDFKAFGDGVEFVAKKYNLGISTVAFDTTVYLAAAIYR